MSYVTKVLKNHFRRIEAFGQPLAERPGTCSVIGTHSACITIRNHGKGHQPCKFCRDTDAVDIRVSAVLYLVGASSGKRFVSALPPALLRFRKQTACAVALRMHPGREQNLAPPKPSRVTRQPVRACANQIKLRISGLPKTVKQ
jgi:hypothetical protein